MSIAFACVHARRYNETNPWERPRLLNTEAKSRGAELREPAKLLGSVNNRLPISPQIYELSIEDYYDSPGTFVVTVTAN